jgi:hypothetical protein
VRNLRVRSIDDLAGTVSGFDTLVLFGNNFGMFGDPDRMRILLTAWAREAPPGARILAESTNPYRGDPGVPSVHRAYQRRNREHGRLPGQFRLRVRYRTSATPWFDWLFVSPAEMRRLVRGTGWELARILEISSSPLYVAILRLMR